MKSECNASPVRAIDNRPYIHARHGTNPVDTQCLQLQVLPNTHEKTRDV
ncbi:MAG: hypothetical protein ACYC0V_07975 [Armatimonadota bacterium]